MRQMMESKMENANVKQPEYSGHEASKKISSPESSSSPMQSPQSEIQVHGQASPQRYIDKDYIIISSQESPEVLCLGEKQARTSTISPETEEELYIWKIDSAQSGKTSQKLLIRCMTKQLFQTRFLLAARRP